MFCGVGELWKEVSFMSYGVSDVSEGELKKLRDERERERGFVDQSKELRVMYL